MECALSGGGELSGQKNVTVVTAFTRVMGPRGCHVTARFDHLG